MRSVDEAQTPPDAAALARWTIAKGPLKKIPLGGDLYLKPVSRIARPASRYIARPEASAYRQNRHELKRLAPLLDCTDPKDLIFSGPMGTYFVFRPVPRPPHPYPDHSVLHFRKGRLRALSASRVDPALHDFTEDGRWLFLAYDDRVLRVDLHSGGSEAVVYGRPQRKFFVRSIAVAGGLLAAISDDRIAYLPVGAKRLPTWEICRNGQSVSAVLGRRILILGTQYESWIYGVSGEWRELFGRLHPGLNRLDFAVMDAWDEAGRVYCRIDRAADTRDLCVRAGEPYHELPQTFEIVGLAETWEAAFGVFGRDAAARARRRQSKIREGALARRTKKARARGQLVLRPVVAPPDPPYPPDVDVGGLYHPRTGRGPYVVGFVPGMGEHLWEWAAFIADARGTEAVTGVLPQGEDANPRFYGWEVYVAHHPAGERFLLARNNYGRSKGEVVEASVEGRQWRSLREFDEPVRGIAYFGDGVAVLFDHVLRWFRQDRTESWRLPRSSAHGPEPEKKRTIFSLMGGRVLCVAGARPPLLLLGCDAKGSTRLLGVHRRGDFEIVLWEIRGRVFIKRNLQRRGRGGLFAELLNIREAYARAFAAPAPPLKRLDGAAAAAARILSLLPRPGER